MYYIEKTPEQSLCYQFHSYQWRSQNVVQLIPHVTPLYRTLLVPQMYVDDQIEYVFGNFHCFLLSCLLLHFITFLRCRPLCIGVGFSC